MGNSSSSSSSSSSSRIRSLLTETQKKDLDDKLIKAAETGDLKTIKKLFQKGADVNAVGAQGWTALLYASYNGHTAIAQYLIDKDANVNAANNDGETALLYASYNGHTAIAQYLIDKGANVNARDNKDRTALHCACSCGHTATAQFLIDNGANVNAMGFFGITALYMATYNDQTEAANLLLQNGANVYLEGQGLSKISDLVLSLRQAHKDLKAICLSDENNQDGAVLDRKINRIKSELLAKYPNLINSPLDEEGNTILNLIADKIVYKEEGREKDGLLRLFVKLAINSSEFKRNVATNIGAKITADYLAEKNLGLDINKMVLGFLKENEGDQNLIKAFTLAETKNYWQYELTLSRLSSSYLGQNTAGGSASSSSSSSITADSSNNATKRSGKDEKYPDANLSTSSSSSSSSSSSIRSSLTDAQKKELDKQLLVAAIIGDIETTKKLFQQGADINAVDILGRAALHWASFNGHTAIAQFLIDKGANVNAADNKGITALHLASYNGRTASARLLIDNGANVHAVDNNGWTALDEASFNGHTETAALLLQNGANVYLEGQDLSKISDLVSPLKKAHEALQAICLSDGNNKGEAVLDGKINRIKSELLAKYPNLINSPLDAKGNTILNLIANEIVSQEEGEEKDGLLRLFVKLVVINSSEFKRNVATNIVAEITADYSADNKKGAINPIDKLLVINNSLKRKILNLDISKIVLEFLKGNEGDKNLIQAFFLADNKGLWQDAVSHYSQASSSDLGQGKAGGSASSSSSSSFTASSSNNATKRSGKDEKYPDANLSTSSSSSSSSSSSIRSSLTEAQKQELDKQLLVAAREGNLEAIKKLFQQEADINAVDNKGWTALHCASYNGQTAIAQFLIDKGADVNAVNKNGRTALHLASLNGHTAAAQLLIDNDANVDAADSNVWTALHLASLNGHTASAQLLIDNGANVNAVDNNGITALHCASYKGQTETATLLLQNGANVFLAGQNLDRIFHIVFSLRQAHKDLKKICLGDGNEKDEADLDKKMDLIRSKLLVNYPNLITSPLGYDGSTILNLIADKIVNQEEGEEKDNLLRLFVKLALINSSEFKRNVTTNIVADVIANYSTDKKWAINPIDKLLVINKKNNSNLDINAEIPGFEKNERDRNLAQAFFLAETKNYWQDAVNHYSQASSSDLGQTPAVGSASSSSSSSITAGSSNNKAARSGKDEAFPDVANLPAPSPTPSDPKGKGAGKNNKGQEK